MENIIIDGKEFEPKIREAFVKQFEDILGSNYSNPVKDAIIAELTKNDGAIKTMVRNLLAEVLTNESFKKLVSDELVKNLLVKGLGK